MVWGLSGALFALNYSITLSPIHLLTYQSTRSLANSFTLLFPVFTVVHIRLEKRFTGRWSALSARQDVYDWYYALSNAAASIGLSTISTTDSLERDDHLQRREERKTAGTLSIVKSLLKQVAAACSGRAYSLYSS